MTHVSARSPRIQPLNPEEIGKEAWEISAALRSSLGMPPATQLAEYHATMLRHAALYQRHSALAIQLFRGALAPRDRELAVLRTAWLCKASYEWGEHVGIAKRMGITREEIERVIVGSKAPGWTEHDRALIRAVEEMREDAIISDDTWMTLSRTLDDRQLIELPILIGQYQGLAYLLNSLGMRLAPDNPGLSAR